MWFGAVYDVCHKEVIISTFEDSRAKVFAVLVRELPDAVYGIPLENDEGMSDEDLLTATMEHFSNHTDRGYYLIIEEDQGKNDSP